MTRDPNGSQSTKDWPEKSWKDRRILPRLRLLGGRTEGVTSLGIKRKTYGYRPRGRTTQLYTVLEMGRRGSCPALGGNRI